IQMDVMQNLQTAGVLAKGLAGPLALSDISLNAEMAGDASRAVVEAEVIPFDPDGRAVPASLVRLDVKPAAVEEVPPDTATMHEVVLEQVFRGEAEKLFACRTVLGEQRVIGLRDALMLEDVIEDAVFVDRVVPLNGFVEHHEKEAVE